MTCGNVETRIRRAFYMRLCKCITSVKVLINYFVRIHGSVIHNITMFFDAAFRTDEGVFCFAIIDCIFKINFLQRVVGKLICILVRELPHMMCDILKERALQGIQNGQNWPHFFCLPNSAWLYF